MTSVPNSTLNDDIRIPQLGFGVFQVPPEETEEAVRTALTTGYRSIDTAAMYGNEEAVGRAIRASGLDRDDIFVTTKLGNDDHGYDAALRAFEASADRLGLGPVDLYLIHWPAPAEDRYVESFKAMVQLRKDGRVRSIGVSNFQPDHLQRLVDEVGVTPSVNQVELHPHLQQAELRAFHAEHGIVTEAWSPLGRGGDLLEEQTLTTIGEKYAKTPAQVVLRWHLQLGNIVIPKSVTPARVEENFALFDFELAEDDMTSIGELDQGRRLGPDPDKFPG